MKKDAEVLLYMKERNKGTTKRVAAARAGMSERTARKYERVLPWDMVDNLISLCKPLWAGFFRHWTVRAGHLFPK